LRTTEHDHAHGHGGAPAHSHRHVHEGALVRLARGARSAGRAQLLRSLGVGLVHGLAGSGAVALLALAAIPDARTAVFYLLVFGAGTLAGMLAISALMERSMLSLLRCGVGAARWMSAGTGALSVAFGLWVMYRTGWVDGLFLGLTR
ncbi:MAG: high-affinity nickel-transport family protein, partial [Elusimicrobia bacterium]|nr:high-affinity nickel-transport family protein [Elusimicrobiota bacterium]